MMLSAIFAAALSTVWISPCDVVAAAEAERVLGQASVPVPAEEMGEETAPSCIWATAHRVNEVKISVWSEAELPVVGMKDAASYYAKMKLDIKEGRDLPGLGERAFSVFVVAPAPGEATGSIVVLKGDRLITFEFVRVKEVRAKAFVAAVMGRL
jgi:hypothetical protein